MGNRTSKKGRKPDIPVPYPISPVPIIVLPADTPEAPEVMSNDEMDRYLKIQANNATLKTRIKEERNDLMRQINTELRTWHAGSWAEERIYVDIEKKVIFRSNRVFLRDSLMSAGYSEVEWLTHKNNQTHRVVIWRVAPGNTPKPFKQMRTLLLRCGRPPAEFKLTLNRSVVSQEEGTEPPPYVAPSSQST